MKRAMATMCLLWVAGSGRAEALAAPSRPIPFDLLKTMHMVVKIKINGKGPYRVIFDTGSPVTLINIRVAKETGMIAKNPEPSLLSLLGINAAGPAKIKTLEIGDLKVENTPALVMDHPTVELISRAFGPVEGILGYPFFARFKMTLDYQARQLTFTPTGFDPPDAMEDVMAVVMALAQNKPAAAKVLTPAAQWGLVLAKEEDDNEPGVIIREVRPGSAAADAGLKAGDRMLTLDGRWTDSPADAYAAAGYVKPGSAAKVVARRNGKEVVVTVKPRPGL